MDALEWNRQYNAQADEIRAWARGRQVRTLRTRFRASQHAMRMFHDDPAAVARVVVLAEILAARSGQAVTA